VLATELWGFPLAAQTSNPVSGGFESNSRRPVSGFISFGTSSSNLYASISGIYTPLTSYINQILTDPEVQIPLSPGNVQSTLSYVGRNHGSKTYGSVPGTTLGHWDLRQTNFLYVDGHVETKRLIDTVYPKFQWGDSMYSLQY
jgi:prepilin-type processing-associated H-X9-DG protein